MSTDRAAQLVEAGIWLKLSGDREGARKLFERALKLDPGNEKAAQLLAGAPAPGEVQPAPPSAPPAPPPPTVPSSLGGHPFERQEGGPPAQSEADWGMATGFRQTPEPSLESDWGRLTGSSTPVPQHPPAVPPVEPGPYSSSSSNVVLGGSPSPVPHKPTMQLFPEQAPAPKTTMQLFTPSAEAPAPKTTLQLFTPPKVPQAVESGAEPGPEAPPPRSAPAIFGSESALNPLPSTPPLFASLQAEAPAPQRTPTEPMGYAWAWSSSSPPPKVADEELPPVPRPSPSLAPRAESAWDQRSNPGIKLEAVVGQDRALDLISSDSKVTRSPEARKEEIRAILRGARDLLDLDDHSGAMELIVKAQTIAPDDPDVLAMRERSEKTLLAMFESKLGKLETIPRVLLKDDEIIWLNLDHRAGFVLAQIDGTVSFDDLFSVSGMSRIDTARILAQLVEEGVISRG